MPEESHIQQLVHEAERAATAGDFTSADQLLRSAARLQEAELGPHHPDIANTLSNLAIVAEKTGRLDDAETFYRRAAAIACASLPADHPAVADTRKNLEDFCRERGLHVEATAPTTTLPPSTRSTRRRPLPRAAAIAIAAAIAGALFVTRDGSSPEAPPGVSISLPAERKTVAPERPAPVEPKRSAPIDAPVPPKSAPNGNRRRTPAVDRRTAATSPRISLADAQLCQTFSTSGRTWRCDPPREPAARGRLVLLTRVKSPRNATVVHRWFRAGTLQQSVRLPIRASSTAGYRTYSRQSINGPGQWRVDVRSAGGELLFEKSFTVK